MNYDVIVVGGGVAGLSAATALAEQHKRVLVLEARPALGGRATAFTDPVTGERVDNGQHVLLGCYRDTFQFLERVGSAAQVPVQSGLELHLVDLRGQASRLRCPRLPPPFDLLAGLIGWRALTWRDRIAALRIPGAIKEAVDGTVRTWLQRHRQTPRLIEMLWEPLALAALNEAIDVAAAAPFARVLSEMLGRAGGAALAVPLKPLDEVYAIPARKFIETRGGEVRINARARIVIEDRGHGSSAAAVIVGDEPLRAQTVVCAVPWFALSSVFPDRPPALRATLDAAARTNPSSIVTVNLWLDREIGAPSLIGMPGRTTQWIFDKRMIFGDRAAHLSLVSSGADRLAAMTNEQIVAHALADVRDAMPGARDAEVRRSVVVREKRATFSVAPDQPPRPQSRTAVPGLVLAGDWIDTGLPATIESAVRSGHRAASVAIGATAGNGRSSEQR